MADQKISADPSANPIDGSEIVPVVIAGTNKRTTAADIAALVTDERIQDVVGAFITAGGNISATYSDVGNTLTIAVTGIISTTVSDFTEATQDVVGAFVVAGANISSVYSDGGNTLTLSVAGLTSTSISDFTETVQDVVGALGFGGSGLTYTYSDVGNTAVINVNVDSTTIEINADTLRLSDNGVSNAKLADMAQSTIKGRAAAAGTGDPTDLTATQVRTLLGVGSTLFDHFADAGNTTTVETDLYSDSIPAGTLNTDGHKLVANYAGIFAANTTTKRVRGYFGGTLVFDSGALAMTAAVTGWTVEVRVVRVSATVVRIVAEFNGVALITPPYTEITGLTLTNAQIMKITGTAGIGGANNDIVAKMSTVDFKPSV